MPCKRTGERVDGSFQAVFPAQQHDLFFHEFKSTICRKYWVILGTEREVDQIFRDLETVNPEQIPLLELSKVAQREYENEGPESNLVRLALKPYHLLVGLSVNKDRYQKLLQVLRVYRAGRMIRHGRLRVQFSSDGMPTNIVSETGNQREADCDAIVTALQQVEHLLRQPSFSVYNRYRRILEQFHICQRICKRLTGENVINSQMCGRASLTQREICNLRAVLSYFERMLQNYLENPPFSTPQEVRIYRLPVIPTCIERSDREHKVLYLFSRSKIQNYTLKMQEYLDTLPRDLDHKINVFEQKIGEQIIENHQSFDMLSEAQRDFFVNAARKQQTKGPVMSCFAMVTLLICLMYSKPIAFCLAAIIVWIHLNGNDKPLVDVSSSQICSEYRRLVHLAKRKKRIQELKNKIDCFLRCNPRCFAVGLEHRTHHKDDYTIVSVGDFNDY